VRLFFIDRCSEILKLRSFPTRRSSDLIAHSVRSDDVLPSAEIYRSSASFTLSGSNSYHPFDGIHSAREPVERTRRSLNSRRRARSEEHTSELQSQSNLVCRLLLEKKNT